MFNKVERIILIIQKNATIEQQVAVKTVTTKGSKESQPFIEIREWWYKFGPTEEPIPTKKGTMVHRENIPKLILALAGEMKPEDVDAEFLASIRTQLARLEGKVD